MTEEFKIKCQMAAHLFPTILRNTVRDEMHETKLNPLEVTWDWCEDLYNEGMKREQVQQ